MSGQAMSEERRVAAAAPWQSPVTEYHFVVRSRWYGGPRARGEFMGSTLGAPFSMPREMAGPGVGTSPEELLLASAASCFLITLSARLQSAEVSFDGIDLETYGRLERRTALRFTDIEHRPRILHTEAVSAEARAISAAEAVRAEEICMISNALRGNLQVRVTPPVWAHPRELEASR
jgi:peroxiredoxin-like protein